MNIHKFYFPVEEQNITLSKNAPWGKEISGYKAIVAPGQTKDDHVISVMKNSYKLVKNRELIEPLIEEVDSLGVRWKIDPSHSFCQSSKMMLQITFPDILIKDQNSDIALSVYLHNSYNGTESCKLIWGGIRRICTNGCVFGTILGSMNARHTKNFSFDDFYEEFGNASDKISEVQRKILLLQTKPVEHELMEELQKALGKRRMQEIVTTDTVPDKSQWDLLNDITYYISHSVEKPKRADLQLKLSKVYEL